MDTVFYFLMSFKFSTSFFVSSSGKLPINNQSIKSPTLVVPFVAGFRQDTHSFFFSLRSSLTSLSRILLLAELFRGL